MQAPDATKRLIDLEAGECRYPVVEDHSVLGHFLFCAKPVEHYGSSYCKAHNPRSPRQPSGPVKVPRR